VESSDLLFKDEVLLTIRRIEQCLPVDIEPSPVPTPPVLPKPIIPFDVFAGDGAKPPGPSSGNGYPTNNNNNNINTQSASADTERVLLTEPLLLPNMEADGRIIFSGDTSHDYWMTVYTALTKRLDRLIKNINDHSQGDHRASASNLFKVRGSY